MDNLTHTLVGLAAGELVARTVRIKAGGLTDATRRTALLVIGMVGGNLPDSDLLWSLSNFTHDNLGYLLEHRGYTHTLIGCAVLAALLYLATWFYLHRKGERVTGSEQQLLGGMALLSVLLHLGMDALNSYGVHPFWPWNDRWYYGDSVFIVEPLYWLAVTPLMFTLATLRARILLALVLFVGCFALLLVHRFAALYWLAPALTLALAWWSRRLASRTAAQLAFALVAAVTALFVASGMAAAERVQSLAAQQFPDFRTLDQVLSPSPAQPLCWDVLLVQRRDDDYAVRRGQLSLTSQPDDSACPLLLTGGVGTAPMKKVAAPDAQGMRWNGEFTMPLATLRPLVSKDCHARELMQFARAPFVAEWNGRSVLGDLRFDRESGIGMAEIVAAPDADIACAYHVPWLPPRGDLLSPR